jgi:phage gpG-like protein
MAAGDVTVPTTEITLDRLAGDLAAKAQALQAAVPQALEAAGNWLVAESRRCFAEGHDPAGNGWPALAYPGAPPWGGLPGSIHATVTGDGVEVGTSHPGAAAHNSGAVIRVPERRRGKGEKPFVFTGKDGKLVYTMRIRAHAVTIPQRTFLDWSPQWVDGVAAVVAQEFGKALGD